MASLKPEEVKHRSRKRGYRVLYSEDWSKCEYEHRYVMEQYLGRKLSRNEVVHHKDRNRMNNDISNLEVMSVSEHTRLHAIENGLKPRFDNYCVDCGKSIYYEATRCPRCAQVNSRKVARPPYEQLMSEIESTSYLAVGKKYGVSDTAVRKWVRWYEREALTCAD